MVLAGGYALPTTKARRAAAAELDRFGGVDGNVSNLSIVSFPSTFDPAHGDIEAMRVELTDDELAALANARRKERGCKRALDRSRRALNPGQYEPSKRQQARAERRQAGGLPERTIETPRGARSANKASVPQQTYRRETLSAGCRLMGLAGSERLGAVAASR
ncbi:hypothetical protein [Streptomyces sp. CA-106110]|uniref:hypothetical protein n=1 Tax=Streptomyces sp. CA-106110 TaxID=3240044 RepID=UPI003D942D3C